MKKLHTDKRQALMTEKKNKIDPERTPDGVLVLRNQAMARDVNFNGDIFGGWVMSQMDIGGQLLAVEIARGRVVTVTVDKLTFLRPVHVGDAVCIYARLIRIGNTSMDIKLEVWAKDPLEEFQEHRHIVTEGVFRYVAIDDNGKPRRVPDEHRNSHPKCACHSFKK